MVVILLLSPPPPTPQPPYTTTAAAVTTTNGCDRGSNDSSTVSTTSTGDTVIPTIYTDIKGIPLPNEATYQHYQPPQPPAPTALVQSQGQQQQQQHHHHLQINTLGKYGQQRQRRQRAHSLHEKTAQQQTKSFYHTTTPPRSSHLRSAERNTSERDRYSNAAYTQDARRAYTRQHGRVSEERAGKVSSTQYPPRIIVSPPPPPSPPLHEPDATDSTAAAPAPPPPPPPLPKSQPPYSPSYCCWCGEVQSHLHSHASYTNPLPKPPRSGATHSTSTTAAAASSNIPRVGETRRKSSAGRTSQARWSIPPAQDPANNTTHQWRQHISPTHSLPFFMPASYSTPAVRQQQMLPANANYYNYSKYDSNNSNNYNNTNTNDYVRHVTRVNFYDVVTSQVEFEPKDDSDECDTEAITKEGECDVQMKYAIIIYIVCVI